MKKLLPFLFLSTFSTFCLANNDSGFFVGGGLAVTINDDCGSYCDTKGAGIETGYFFNKFVGVDAKLARTEFDSNDDLSTDSSYVGLNVGHTFNSSWARLYAKLGYYKAKTKDDYYNESLSDSNTAFGFGVVFTPFAHQSGFYIRLESIVSEFKEEDVGFGELAIGYQF